MKFEIPDTMEKAEDEAVRLGEESSLDEWSRAAIVYASVWVSEDGGRPSKTLTAERLAAGKVSATTYANKGIIGLKSPQTVRLYWKAWVKAMEELGWDQLDIHFGDKVDLPVDLDWCEIYLPPKEVEMGPFVEDPPPPPAKPKKPKAKNEESAEFAEDGRKTSRNRNRRNRNRLMSTCPKVMGKTIDDFARREAIVTFHKDRIGECT